MKLYADTPALRAKQVLGDGLAIAWVALWVVVARFVRSLIDSLAGPVGQLRGTGVTLGDAMRKGASAVGDVPLVGDKLVAPFDQGAGAGDQIIRTSDDLVTRIHDVSFWTAMVVGGVPIAIGLLWWVGRRLAFVRTASLTQRFLDADADLDLFALRAMATQPLDRLDAVSHDPVGAWRARDVDVIRRLAAMELADAGLRPPAEGSMSARSWRGIVAGSAGRSPGAGAATTTDLNDDGYAGAPDGVLPGELPAGTQHDPVEVFDGPDEPYQGPVRDDRPR